MAIYQIKQITTGAVLWTGGAENERQALDAMAREAGYTDYDALPEDLRSAHADRLNLG